jgi:hypothetical protein
MPTVPLLLREAHRLQCLEQQDTALAMYHQVRVVVRPHSPTEPRLVVPDTDSRIQALLFLVQVLTRINNRDKNNAELCEILLGVSFCMWDLHDKVALISFWERSRQWLQMLEANSLIRPETVPPAAFAKLVLILGCARRPSTPHS